VRKHHRLESSSFNKSRIYDRILMFMKNHIVKYVESIYALGR
jgi:hypothetical protein